VTLLWTPAGGDLAVCVLDDATGRSFELTGIDGTSALDVFHHPYAYAAFRGVDFTCPGDGVTEDRVDV
jgi:hypothetical protein